MNWLAKLWDSFVNGVATVVKEVYDFIVEELVPTIYWLVEVVFDAINSVIELIDWLGSILGIDIFQVGDTGGVAVLPPTDALMGIMKDLEEKGMVVKGTVVKLQSKKAAVQAVIKNDKVEKVVVAGSEKGFSKDIDSALSTGKLFQVPIEG